MGPPPEDSRQAPLLESDGSRDIPERRPVTPTHGLKAAVAGFEEFGWPGLRDSGIRQFEMRRTCILRRSQRAKSIYTSYDMWNCCGYRLISEPRACFEAARLTIAAAQDEIVHRCHEPICRTA